MKTSTRYTKDQILDILKNNNFEYQKVQLPYDLHTPGEDRTTTKNVIFPSTLNGKTVLDIGSANGYFCFEAETLGAKKVVGIELKEKRFQHANLLKGILESSVEFVNKDVFEIAFEERFDYVLLLNVIHHIKEPIRLFRFLASITNEKLIIEFPTFSDPKFTRHSLLRFSPFSLILNMLPLIGVSSLKDRQVDQTFIFTKKAIKRIFQDHDVYFKNITFQKSEFGRGRLIAICSNK